MLTQSAKENGGERIRTDDPLLAKQVLYQLSYAPVLHPERASRRRKSRQAASRLPRQCRGPLLRSGRLMSVSDGFLAADAVSCEKWAREDLNLRPHAYQACALTN